MSTLALDHLILVIGDLKAASSQFEQLGFTVVPGGVHAGGLTYNALVPFSDGTYLELLAATRPSTLPLLKILRRFRLLGFYTANQTAIGSRLIEDIATGTGLNDFALVSLNLDLEITNLRERGLLITDPIPGGRIRPDGQEIEWRTAVPTAPDLPFLIDDVTPREKRVPAAGIDMHSNGIIGIAGITILVSSMVKSIAHFRSLLGGEPETQATYPQPGTQSSEFKLEDQFLALAGPLPGGSSMRKFLHPRSARPIGIYFKKAKDELEKYVSLTYLPGRGATLSHSRILLT